MLKLVVVNVCRESCPLRLPRLVLRLRLTDSGQGFDPLIGARATTALLARRLLARFSCGAATEQEAGSREQQQQRWRQPEYTGEDL